MTDEYPEADEAASYLLQEASKIDIPEEDREDVDWKKLHEEHNLEDHGITAPDTDGEDNES